MNESEFMFEREVVAGHHRMEFVIVSFSLIFMQKSIRDESRRRFVGQQSRQTSLATLEIIHKLEENEKKLK